MLARALATLSAIVLLCLLMIFRGPPPRDGIAAPDAGIVRTKSADPMNETIG